MLELPLPLTATDAVATPPCFALPACATARFAAAKKRLGQIIIMKGPTMIVLT